MTENILEDPDMVIFLADRSPQPGEVKLHSLNLLDTASRLFGRRKEDVAADWAKVTGQIREFISATEEKAPTGFSLDTLSVSLGFSAQGRIIFIAEAGVEASVTVTFKRSS